jgi:hypothetical protein
MQEHIKRLAVEAGLVDHENTFGQVMIAHGPYNAELTAFAQAVARECAQIVGDAPMSSYRALEMAQKAIRARFGVE